MMYSERRVVLAGENDQRDLKPPYTDPCNDHDGICVAQVGARQHLDTLSGYMMPRFAYRNFGDHEALVVNHNVGAELAPAAVRWYEIRNP
jgi:hypothetical protein